LLADTGYVSLSHWCLAKSQSLFRHFTAADARTADEVLQPLWLRRSVPTDTSCSEINFNFFLLTHKSHFVNSFPLCLLPRLSLPLLSETCHTMHMASQKKSKFCLACPAGMNGTDIENFVCVIFNVSFMNCTWHVGRTATEDTQYYLYWRPSK
ncbi:CSF2R factor, partial [Sylvia borin]|nr:CSF2R factor [Sylvia borin]